LECHIKDCGHTDFRDSNLIMTCSGTTYGETCSFSCPSGYDLVNGNSASVKAPFVRTCAEDGAWTGNVPSCKIKDCGVISVANAELQCDGTQFGDKCTATCSVGYSSTGSVEHTCTETGTWGGAPTQCTIVSCGALSAPKDGTIACGGETYEEECNFSCATGYEMSGANMRRCQADGTWSEKETQCDIVSCPALVNPTFGEATCTGTQYGQTCSIACNTGYTLSGSSSRQCQASKIWSGSDTTCTKVECGPLSPPVNGGAQCSGSKYSDSCQFTCDAGYDFIGSAKRSCGASGAWTGEQVQCKIKDCGSLSTVPDGTVSLSEGTEFGASALYSCTTGYKLKGDATRKCEHDGTWSGSISTCELIKCPVLGAPASGSVVCQGQLYQEECQTSCNKGHILSGSTQRKCMEDSQWDGTDTVCTVVDCGGLDTPLNGAKTCEDTKYGKSCTFTCDAGHDMSGSVVRTCEASGVWSGSKTSCTPKDCGVLAQPNHGAMSCTGSTYGNVCHASCDAGFTFCGSQERKCLVTGKWDGLLAECKKTKCDALTTPTNGALDNREGTAFGSKALLSCNIGYTLTGASTRTCQPTAQWDGAATACTIKDCGNLPDLVKGTKTCTGTTFGETCNFSCDPGHERSGPASRKCNQLGEWEGVDPSCQAHDCGDPEHPVNGAKSCPDGTKFGSQCMFSCITGYKQAGGSAKRTCEASKLWSGSAFTCEIKNCGNLPTLTNGDHDCTGTTFGSTCSSSCETGYERTGSTSRKCLETGKWSGSEARCTIVD
jgi:CUB/sushi domain-containing protein